MEPLSCLRPPTIFPQHHSQDPLLSYSTVVCSLVVCFRNTDDASNTIKEILLTEALSSSPKIFKNLQIDLDSIAVERKLKIHAMIFLKNTSLKRRHDSLVRKTPRGRNRRFIWHGSLSRSPALNLTCAMCSNHKQPLKQQ